MSKIEEKPKWSYWFCPDCWHDVLAIERPEPIHWTNGHVCRFVLSEMDLKPKVRLIGRDLKPKVRLIGRDGNAFAILSACRKALEKAGRIDLWPAIEADATSGDYAHLLAVVARHFDVN
jgi:hypothetical protein